MTRKLYLITVSILMLANAMATVFLTLHFGWEHRGQGALAVLSTTIISVAIWYQIIKAYDRGPLQ